MSRLLDMEISFKIKINDYTLFSKILNRNNDFFADDRCDAIHKIYMNNGKIEYFVI